MDVRPERRLLSGRLRAALPAAADGSRLRLPGREQRRALGAGRRVRPVTVRRHGAGGDVRAHAFSAHRRPAVPAHPRTKRILLVPAETRLIDFIRSRRWFASKTREVTQANVLDRASLHEGEPELNVEL